MLVAENIRKTYPTRAEELVILSDINLTLSAGEAVVVMGPSGSGKTTLLNILGALDRPTSGSLCIDGQNPFSRDDTTLAEFRNQKVGFIFQSHHLLPQCNVLENVLLPTLAHPAGHHADHHAHDADPQDRALELLERVGLSHRLDHRPSELSGGERQRTAIARALINRPALVLADEPTGNLDRKTADSVADLLVELPNAYEASLVVVTHSQSLADRFDKIVELVEGRLE